MAEAAEFLSLRDGARAVVAHSLACAGSTLYVCVLELMRLRAIQLRGRRVDRALGLAVRPIVRASSDEYEDRVTSTRIAISSATATRAAVLLLVIRPD